MLDLGVLSRPHLVRDMPRTAAALDARGFVDFLRYASLGDAGDGAAPGRAALLGDGAATGLWAELRAGGYATFAAHDACPDGRPALPDVDYGAALRAACCSDGDGDPPHYLWGTAAARLLLSHYEQFARAYGPGGGRPRVPTASLLVFVDADEDSLALATRPSLRCWGASRCTVPPSCCCRRPTQLRRERTGRAGGPPSRLVTPLQAIVRNLPRTCRCATVPAGRSARWTCPPGRVWAPPLSRTSSRR